MLKHISRTRTRDVLPTRIHSPRLLSGPNASDWAYSSVRRSSPCLPLQTVRIEASIHPSNRGQAFFSFYHARQSYFSSVASVMQVDDSESSVAFHTKSDSYPDDKNYLSCLNKWFRENHGLTGKDIRDAFEYERFENLPPTTEDITGMANYSGVTHWWTSSFTDPVTHQKFDSLKLANIPSLLMNGKHYYTKKRHAKYAAVAKFLQDKELDLTPNSSSEIDENTELQPSAQLKSQPAPFRDSNNNPRSWLQDEYRKLKVFPTSENFQFLSHSFGGESGQELKRGIWWTASFQCPITQQWYAASDMKQCSSDLKLEHGGCIWYRTKPNAAHAASATALEYIDWNTLTYELEERGPDMALGGLRDEQHVNFLESSVQPLVDWFKQEHDIGIGIDEMENYFVATQKTTSDDVQHWTASFLSPVSGERFDAGTIVGLPSTTADGLVWYTSKSVAMEAAALRAHDILRFRKSGFIYVRHCSEHPSADPSPCIDTKNVDPNNLKDVRSESMDFQPPKESITSLSNESTSQNEDEQEEDFIIEMIPQQSSLGQGNGVNTLDIIAETWMESTMLSSYDDEEDSRIEDVQIRLRQRQEAIDRASKWLCDQNKFPKQPSSSDRTNVDAGGKMNGLPIANVILSSLAETHQRVPFHPQPAGVERAADAILESMMTSKQYAPDANTYAYYLKCLEGETPAVIAERAEKIVLEMETGQDSIGRPLPRPNASVYASLMQVKAITGDMALSCHLTSIPPTREMFLAALSSMAHHPDGFNADIGMKFIQQMEETSNDVQDMSLKPDIEAFNAALRWSGGAFRARRFSRALPWDSYSEIFKDGFLCNNSPENPAHRQAFEMEKWLECLERHGLSPTTETFESIIQAWVRCGTEYGLNQAEKYSHKFICGDLADMSPCIQTFYPILAGWAYCGSQDGPENVEKLLKNLQQRFKHLDRRRRFVSLPFLSSLAVQNQSLSLLATGTTRGNKLLEKIQGFGSSSLLNLDKLVCDFKEAPNFFLPGDVFVLTANSFYLTSTVADSIDELEQCFEGIRKTELLYEGLLVWLYRNQTEKTKYQLFHLLKHAPSIYSTHLSTLEQCNRISRKIGERWDLTQHLLVLEERVRRSREFLQYLDDAAEDALDKSLDLGDSDAFPIDKMLKEAPCATWPDFWSKALTFLSEEVDLPMLHKPEAVRLCIEISKLDDTFATARQVRTFLSEVSKKSCPEKDQEMIRQILERLDKTSSKFDTDNNDQSIYMSSEIKSSSEDGEDNYHGLVSSRRGSPTKTTRPKRSRSRGSSFAPKRPSTRAFRPPRPHQSTMAES
ncbi:hypothetical protein IV203_005378 [Nitzschia inconspicua]|uniref:Uncharacterized protein n=1 Tax=Nitzschia inconspicua TaxID=303405 RepID=A0A9K3KM89_9STRA|nr:hypothetical protein IV203_005378 [Nitzschia inconspicua]